MLESISLGLKLLIAKDLLQYLQSQKLKGALMSKKKYLEIVSSGPKPGKDKEYLEWYRKHIDDMFKFGGVKRVTLNKAYQPVGEKGPLSPVYITLYEFDSKEDIAFFYEKVMLPSARGPLKNASLPDCVDVYWASYYEPVITLEK
jgi:hypothetical protein